MLCELRDEPTVELLQFSVQIRYPEPVIASKVGQRPILPYMLTHPFDSGNSDCQTVLDQLYHAYAESHEHDPQEIGDGFKELEEYLCVLPLDNNNAVFNLCCRLCSAYERKAFLDGLQYGAELMLELGKESDR